MQLVSIKYSEFAGQPKEWDLDHLTFEQITLIVGKNTSGKTRTLHIVNNLARLIRGDCKPTYNSANFDATFKHNDKINRYKIKIMEGNVVEETFQVDDKLLMTRGQDGVGKIYAQQLNTDMDFQTPTTDIALAVRRDNIQHPFFEPLYEWTSSVLHYAFGTPLGKDVFGLFRKNAAQIDPKNTNMVVPIYKRGEDKYGDQFKNIIKSDLREIGYELDDLGLAPPSIIKINSAEDGELMGLWVQEAGLKGRTEQSDISQGMFRALSLIIHLNYSILTLKPTCILIDDIGEGLDYERSYSLINLLLSKIKQTDIQLIMTTNDRFVMNNVPLEMWTILDREGSHCKVFNSKNAKDKFDSFRFTGLNNFDFFASDFLKTKDSNKISK